MIFISLRQVVVEKTDDGELNHFERDIIINTTLIATVFRKTNNDGCSIAIRGFHSNIHVREKFEWIEACLRTISHEKVK